ncbi:MAG: hypothetical protein KGO81_06025 [Bacteroidota bacterium]|nr:hypothetical protein [Bacteroidota bacterium]
MNVKYFNLYDGVLEFHAKKLVILDKAKQHRTILILLSITSLTFAISTSIKGSRHHDTFDLYFGLCLTLIWLSGILYRWKDIVSVENEIFISDVKQVKFSTDKLTGCTVAKINTKNNRRRKIKLVNEYNQDFEFRNLLMENGINIK